MKPTFDHGAILLALPDSLNEATRKTTNDFNQRLHNCSFQNYKNMRNKRTVAKGKRLSKVFFFFFKDLVTAKYSLTFHSYVFR